MNETRGTSDVGAAVNFAAIEDAREAIAGHCRTLAGDGLVVGTAGNLSIRVGDLVAITPTGVPYQRLTPASVPVIDRQGRVVDGELRPSSEWALHLAALHATGDRAVVHTHSPAATAVACLEAVGALPAVHYYVAMFGGPPRVAPYARYGTPELARSVERALQGRTGALMGNHGAVVTGADLDEAYEKARELEWLCDVYLRTLASGRPRILSEAAIGEVLAALQTYGQQGAHTS